MNITTLYKYIDFIKVFEKVPHQRLLNKVRAHGIEGKALNWSCLNYRQQSFNLWLKIRVVTCK